MNDYYLYRKLIALTIMVISVSIPGIFLSSSSEYLLIGSQFIEGGDKMERQRYTAINTHFGFLILFSLFLKFCISSKSFSSLFSGKILLNIWLTKLGTQYIYPYRYSKFYMIMCYAIPVLNRTTKQSRTK